MFYVAASGDYAGCFNPFCYRFVSLLVRVLFLVGLILVTVISAVLQHVSLTHSQGTPNT